MNVLIKPLRKRLDAVSRQTRLRLDIVQQDYLLSWILAGLFQHPHLKKGLAFKGGTALKKCYFGSYRFSEDLDFTATSLLPRGPALFKAIREACKRSEQEMEKYAPIRVYVEEYKEKTPHPHQQEAYKIKAQFPWQREPLTTVMVEISQDESLIFPLKSNSIYHDYEEPIDTRVECYPLEEIVLEKLRAILQHTKKLHERDWTRSRVRDYYDLWSIFTVYGNDLTFSNFTRSLEEKCHPKEVSFTGVNSFFSPEMLIIVEKTWLKWLGPLVRDLPHHNEVINELKLLLKPLFRSKSLIQQ